MTNPPIPATAIGYRLLNELEGILLGITADGRIEPGEQARLQRWLSVCEPCRHIRPFSEMSWRVAVALADGVLTVEECEDLLFVTRNFSRPNPHFGALRAGIEILLGHLAGIVADGRLTEAEMRKLVEWSEEWSHLAGLWPFDEIVAVVTRLLVGNAPAQLSYETVRSIVDTFPLSGEYEGSWAPPIIQGVCAVDPVIEWTGRRFVFTGESVKSPRAAMEETVRERGGVPQSRVTQQSNYLIVCDDGSPHWAFSCYGRKVEQAHELRRSGFPIVLVQEIDFWDATR